MKAKNLYIVYDARASDGDTDDASVYVSCNSLKEAKQYVRESFNDGVIFKYDITEKNELINETREL